MQWRAEVLGCPGPTRFLDARGQRGSWMPGANEVLGCPGPTRFLDAHGRTNPSNFLSTFSDKFIKKNFSIRLPKFLTTSFSHLPQNFPVSPENFFNLSLKISDDLF